MRYFEILNESVEDVEKIYFQLKNILRNNHGEIYYNYYKYSPWVLTH